MRKQIFSSEMREVSPGEIEAAKQLYFKHGVYPPKALKEIKKAMHALGWKDFDPIDLTGDPIIGRVGFIEEFGWRALRTNDIVNERIARMHASGFRMWLDRRFPEWEWNRRYQIHLQRHLNRLTAGLNRRLMIFMPPRHGKSEMVTIRYTAWRLEADPRLKIIIGSYNQKLANRFSRMIRRLHRYSMPADPNTGKSGERTINAADEWETDAGGGVKAVGVGAGVTGFGADLIVIDDPVKSRSEAESRSHRERLWEWYSDDIYTRLEPKASIVLIQTRWHEDDLAGRLIEQMADGGEAWQIVSLPAIAESDDPLGRKPGQALWRKRFDVEHLEKVRRQQGSYSFSSLYQQRPMPLAGGIFKRSSFDRVVSRPPAGLKWARGYDLAISTKTTADYTASFRCAFDSENNLYIADGFRRRIDYPEQRRYVTERMNREQDTIHGIEKALHGEALVQDIRRDAAAGRFRLIGINVITDKVTRSLRLQSLAEDGKVVLVRGTWMHEFLDEICSFPNGMHDDQVDAVNLAIEMLQRSTGRFHRF